MSELDVPCGLVRLPGRLGELCIGYEASVQFLGGRVRLGSKLSIQDLDAGLVYTYCPCVIALCGVQRHQLAVNCLVEWVVLQEALGITCSCRLLLPIFKQPHQPR